MQTDELRPALEAVADSDRAEPMAAYMRNLFPFLGIATPALRQTIKPFVATGAEADGDDLVAAAHWCWEQPEREFQYVGTILLRRWVKALEPNHIEDLEILVSTKSWWDTVDSLAAWSVGPLVRAEPALVDVMDQWIDGEDIWLARTAILHQLSFKDDTDAERLYRYAMARAGDTEFFIRKAIGWALRQYARQDPDGVRSFVETNRQALSGLTVREALKHLG